MLATQSVRLDHSGPLAESVPFLSHSTRSAGPTFSILTPCSLRYPRLSRCLLALRAARIAPAPTRSGSVNSATSTLPTVALTVRAPLVDGIDALGNATSAPPLGLLASRTGARWNPDHTALRRVSEPAQHRIMDPLCVRSVASSLTRWAFPSHPRMASSPPHPARALATCSGPPATLRAWTERLLSTRQQACGAAPEGSARRL